MTLRKNCLINVGMKKKTYKLDLLRMKGHGHQPYLYFFMRWLRKSQESKVRIIRFLYRVLFHIHSTRRGIEICTSTKIGPGFCLWHQFNITIGQKAVIGKNVTLNKNCLIGREFRGDRNGLPTIGDNVWVGANACIVGKVIVGSNVLIAPNSFVNCDVPDNSIVFGNPCIIKYSSSAVDYYIQNRIEWFE